MSTITATPLTTPSDPAEFYRLTVDQYERMVADGTIAEDDRVELLDGILVRTMPKGPRHETAVWRGRRRIEREVPDGWHVRSEASVRIPDYNEPQPDISVVRGDGDDYEGRHPGPGDLALLVEVAEATLSRDRERSGRTTRGPAFPPTGSSTWSTNSSRSTRARRMASTRPRPSSAGRTGPTWCSTASSWPGSPWPTSCPRNEPR